VIYGDTNMLIAESHSSSKKKSMDMTTASFTILSKLPSKENNGSRNQNSANSPINPMKSPNWKKNTSTSFYIPNKSIWKKKNNGRFQSNHMAKTFRSSNLTSQWPSTILDPILLISNYIANSKPYKKNKAKNTSITSIPFSKNLEISSSKTLRNSGNSSCSIYLKKFKSPKTDPTKTFTTNSTWSYLDKLKPSSI
jgi:hypothetical protein